MTRTKPATTFDNRFLALSIALLNDIGV